MSTTVTCHCGTKFEPPGNSAERRVNCPSCGSVIFLAAPPSGDDAQGETYGISDSGGTAAIAAEPEGVLGVPGWFDRYRSDREVKKSEREKTIGLLERVAAVNPTLDPLGSALYLAATHSDAETSVAALAKVAISGHPSYSPVASMLMKYVGPDDVGGAQQLVVLLQETSDPQAALLLCNALTAIGPTIVVQIRNLIDLLAGKHAASHLWAVQSLIQMGPAARSAIPAIIKAMQSGHHELRLATIDALGAIARDPERSLPVLQQVLKHQNPQYRARAAGSLGKFGDAAAVAISSLKAATKDSDPAVVLAATAALKELEESGAKPAASAAPAESAEPILVPCACGKKLKVKAAYAGRKVKCPACSGIVAVPAAKSPAPAEAPAPRAATEKDCPACLAAVPAAVVLCVHCGYDFRTGKTVAGTPVGERGA